MEDGGAEVQGHICDRPRHHRAVRQQSPTNSRGITPFALLAGWSVALCSCLRCAGVALTGSRSICSCNSRLRAVPIAVRIRRSTGLPICVGRSVKLRRIAHVPDGGEEVVEEAGGGAAPHAGRGAGQPRAARRHARRRQPARHRDPRLGWALHTPRMTPLRM